jgi:predicted HD superfamily hydrolase involved in NAD metabolism
VLASKYGIDSEKAWMSGALHDIARDWPEEKLLKFCKENNIRLNDDETRDFMLIHGKIAVFLLPNELGINDKEILDAIETHTSGGENLSKLQEILYLADFLESTVGQEKYKYIWKSLEASLESAIREVNDAMAKYITSLGKPLRLDFQKCFNYYKKS